MSKHQDEIKKLNSNWNFNKDHKDYFKARRPHDIAEIDEKRKQGSSFFSALLQLFGMSDKPKNDKKI